MMETILSLRDVNLEYKLGNIWGNEGKFKALLNINIDIKEGDTLGVMGRNGCGKSSLLRIMAGIT